jgi:hypothetical protein
MWSQLECDELCTLPGRIAIARLGHHAQQQGALAGSTPLHHANLSAVPVPEALA